MGKQRKDDNKSSDFGYGQYYLDNRSDAEKEKEDAEIRASGKALQEWQNTPKEKRSDFETFKKEKQSTEPIKKLWTAVNEEYELPDFETFKSDMADESKRNRLWETIGTDYELPDFPTFSTEMGFSAKSKKKSGGTISGLTSSDGLTFGTYVDNGLKLKTPETATDGSSQKPAKEEKGFWETVWGGVTDYLTSPASNDEGGIFTTAEETADIQDRKNAEKQAKQKQTAEDAYVTNIDAFTSNTTGAFENIYIKNNFPDKWQEIQNAKASGDWNVGADPVDRAAAMTNTPFANPLAEAVTNAVSGAVEDFQAWWTGEKNDGDDARMYLDANNWVAQQQSSVIKKLETTQDIKAFKSLQAAASNNPVSAQLQEIGAVGDKLKDSPAVIKFNSFIQNKGKELSKEDYAAYQQMLRNPDVAAFIKAQNDYNAVLESEGGKQLQQTMGQVQDLYQNSKDVQLYTKIGDAAQVTTGALQNYATKFPKQYFAQVLKESEQLEKDSELKKLNPVVRGALEITNSVAKVIPELIGGITSGAIDLIMSPIGPGGLALAVEDAFGDPANAQKVRAFTNSISDGIVELTTAIGEEAFPTTSRLQRPLIDRFVPYDFGNLGAFRVILDDEGNAIDLVDADGYMVPSETKSGILEAYRNDPNKPKEVNSFNTANLLPRMAKTGADLVALAYVPQAGAAFGLGHKGSMAMYGYLTSVHRAYDEIKATDPFVTDEAAMAYANFYGAVTAGAFTLTPQSLFGGKNAQLGFQELRGDYMSILQGGVSSKVALQRALGKQMVKSGAEMGAFGVALNVVDFVTKKTANAITGRESVKGEISWEQMAETGLLMFAAGSVTAGIQRKGFKDKVQGEALYTALKNYEGTIEILKMQLEAGELSEQDFNRVYNTMTELKPIYDNLADLGKYNEAYKTGLIALYAEKLRVQEKLANIDAGKEKKSVLSMGKSPDREMVAKQLEEIDNEIENLAIVNNPDFIVYTTSASLEVDQEVQTVLGKINDMKQVWQKNGTFMGGLSDRAIVDALTPQERTALSKAGKLVLNERGEFQLVDIDKSAYTGTIGKMYIFDEKTGRFMAVKEAVGSPESVGDGYQVLDQPALGVRVATPRYKVGGETITRDQLQAKMKDSAFLADLISGRVRLDIFNDLEMESMVRKFLEPNLASRGIREQAGEEGPIRTEPVEQPVEPTAETAQPEIPEVQIGGDVIPQPITTENLPAGPAAPKQVTAGDPTLVELEGREIQSKNGNVGSVEQSEDGTWYVTFKDGTSKQLPVADKTNPTETISGLGYKLASTAIVEAPTVEASVMDVTTSTWTEPKVQMVSPNGYTFNIDGIGAVAWMKFNYSNNGALKTADVITADGSKLKIRDIDIVNDMANQMAYSHMTRLSMKPEVVSTEIANSVQPLKESLDIGMKSINSIVENAGDAAIIITRIQDGEIVSAAEQTAAFEYIVDAAARINKIDTKHETEKGNTLQWLNEVYNQVANAEVELERPSESVAAKQGGAVGTTAETQPSAPTKQQYFEHPEISSQTRAVIGRLVGKEGVEPTIEAVRKAFEEGRNPAEAFGQIKEATRPYVEKVIAAMQPAVSEVAPAPKEQASIEVDATQGRDAIETVKKNATVLTAAETEADAINSLRLALGGDSKADVIAKATKMLGEDVSNMPLVEVSQRVGNALIKLADKELEKLGQAKSEAPAEKVYTYDKQGNVVEAEVVQKGKSGTTVSIEGVKTARANSEVFNTKEAAEAKAAKVAEAEVAAAPKAEAEGVVKELLEDEAAFSKRPDYKYGELYKQDPRLAAIETIKEEIADVEASEKTEPFIKKSRLKILNERLDALQKSLGPTEAEPVSKAEVKTPEVTKSAEAEIEEVKGVITVEGLETSLNNETAEILSGSGAARRAAGEFVQDGVVYTRNPSVLYGPVGDGDMVRFASGVEVPFNYKLVEADKVQPSHVNGYRNPLFFIPEAQPKNRNDAASKAAERSFAQSPRMNELGENTNAYSGAPIVNARGEVIQGNNRAAGLKIGYEEGNMSYKEQLANQAEKFGFTYEQVMEMKNPILVRRVDVADDFAIELGNYDAKDLETGGVRAIDPVATSRRMPVEAKQALTDLLFNSDYKTTNEAIKGLGSQVMNIIGPYINNAQRMSIASDGKLNANGVNQIEALVSQFMFDNAGESLPDMYEQLPYNAKQGISKALPYLFSVPAKQSLLPDLQVAMIAANAFTTSGISDFKLWTATPDMFNNSLTPKEIFSPLELKLAEMLMTSKTQKGIADVFAKYAEASKGRPADMFEEEKLPATKTEAVRQTFNIEYNEKGPQIKGTTSNEGIDGEENTPQFSSPDAYGEGLSGQVTPSKASAESIVEAISRQVGIENNPLDFEVQKVYDTPTGYPEHTIASIAVKLGVDSQGIIRSGKTKAEIERALSSAYDVTVEPVDGDPANGYKILLDGVYYFNPFEKQNRALENAELNNNEVPYKQVLDQRTAMFQESQFNFDKNDNVQQAKSDVGNVKFVSAIDTMLQYGGRTKIEKEYQAILKEYRSRNIPNAKANRLAELREMIGNERAAELAQDVVRKITAAQVGELKPGEYALRARSVSISKDNFAVGKSKITSPADVAYLAKGLEDLTVEHFMVYVVDQNGQGHLVHIASGAERSVVASHGAVLNAIKAFNAKGFYLIHNHPNGTTQASPQDFDRTKEFGDIAKLQGVDMYGHVIVDHDKGTYGFVSAENAQTIIDAKRQKDVVEEVDYPVYMLGNNWDITNPPPIASGTAGMPSDYAEAARLAAMTKVGFAPKGGAIISQGGKVLGHIILDGKSDIQRIQRMGAQVGGGHVITYGTFSDAPFPINTNFYPGLRMLDHVWHESSNLISYQKRFNVPYVPSQSVSFNSVTSPFGDKPTPLQKAIEKTMNEGNLPFDFMMLDLFENHFKGDVIKTRKALQDIKDAYDEMSFSNENWLDEVSSIDEVASFNLDNFLKSIRKPEIKEQSLRQKYNDFASWFEWKYPGAKFYYTLDFDPQTGQIGFKIGDEFVKKEDGTPLLYSDWSNNKTVQKEWTEVGSKEVFSRPPLVTLDQDIIPTPVEHVASNQYNIDEGQKFAVNLILTRFLGDGEPRQTMSAFRTTGTGLGKLGVAHRGTGTYYALDAPFKLFGAEGQQVSKVEIYINPYNTLDLTSSYGQQVFAEIQKEAKARFDATPQFYRKPNMANDLIKDVALERGIEGVISYIEPGAPKEERDRIGREYVSYAGKELEPKGQKGFVLGDGMGIGKTRIAITTAVEMSRAKGLPALIITKGDLIVEQFRSEAAAMSMKDIAFKDNKGKIAESETGVTVGTYEDMKNGKLGNLDKYAVIVFDEAHQMKNVRSARARVADDLMGQAEHVVFATGTPMDKPGQIVYFIKHMSNVPVDVQLDRLGLVYKNGRLYGKGNVKVKEAIIKWRNSAIEEGAYLRREYPFYGTVESVYIPMDQDVIDTLNEIKEQTGGRNAIMDANRYQEHTKVPYVLNETMKAIADGKQVVVFCVGVNPTEIKIGRKDFKISLGYVPQFAGLFAEKLKAAGVPFSEIYGDDIPRKMEESRKFQRGETKVAIATIASGGTGIDLDDQVGDAPREVIFATLPWSADNYDQAVYRTSRRNTKTPSRTRFLFGVDSWADAHKERLLKEKNETLRNIQAGMDPDEAKMMHWRTDVEGGFVDIAEDEYDENGNDISSVSKGEVMSVPSESKTKVEPATPEELFDAVQSGDKDAMREVGMLPAIIPSEQYIEVTEDTQAGNLPLFPETPQQVASEGQVPVTPPSTPSAPKPSGPTTSAMPSTPTTPPVSPAKKSSATDLGTATITPESEIPKIPYRTSNAKYKLQDIWNRVMNGKQRLDLATAVIRELQLMGVPTTGEYHLNVKNALGWYSHLQKDVKLKFSQDMFVAVHEGTHWVDFSAGDNITNKIILNGSRTLKEELGKIYELYYPGAKPNADEELQVKEGLTMFMQIRLYNGSSPRDFPTVFADVFTKGGQFYHPKMDELFARFARLKNEVMTAPAGKKIGMRLASGEKLENQHTISTWNNYQKYLHNMYDESTALRLWDKMSGVSLGTAMERLAGNEDLQPGSKITGAQQWYFMWRNRMDLAANAISQTKDIGANIVAMGDIRPMFYDINGQWKPAQYRMSDLFTELKNIGKKGALIQTGMGDVFVKDIASHFNEVNDIMHAFDSFLVARRIHSFFEEMNDIELGIKQIIANGASDYRILNAITDPDMYDVALANFKKNHVRPLEIEYAKWKKLNSIISNEGSSHKTENKLFVPSVMAWASPLYSNPVASWNPAAGDLVSFDNVSEVMQKYSGAFAKASGIYDVINHQYGILQSVAFGLVNPATANKWLARNAKYGGYASFQRHVTSTVLSDEGSVSGGPVVGADQLSFTYAMGGSERTIFSPLKAQAAMIYEVFRKGNENKMWMALASQAKNNTELSRSFAKLKTTYVPEERNGETVLKPVVPGKMNVQGANIVTFKYNGRTQNYAILGEEMVALYMAMKNHPVVDSAIDNVLYQIAKLPAVAFQMGTTGIYMQFALQNLPLDQLSMGVNSYNKVIPIYTSVRNGLPAIVSNAANLAVKTAQAIGLYKKLFPGKTPTSAEIGYLNQYISMVGSNQTLFGDLRSQNIREGLNRLADYENQWTAKRLIRGGRKVVETSLSIAAAPTVASEFASRAMGEFINAMKRGYTAQAALMYAMEIAPFQKRGAARFAYKYMPLVPYMRPGQAMFVKGVEEIKERPARNAAIIAASIAMGAYLLASMYDAMTQDQKDDLAQKDGNELSKYLYVPSQNVPAFLRSNPDVVGDTAIADKNGFYKVRIPEQIGSWYALGYMAAFAQKDSAYKFEKSRAVRAVTTPVPTWQNPYEWLYGDADGVTSSIFRNMYQNTPQVAKLFAGPAINYQVTQAGHAPVYPRQVENFNPEHLYKVGRNGTSALAMYLSEKAGYKVDPITIDYMGASFLGREYYYITDLMMGKEGRNLFIEDRDKYNVRGSWYDNFYRKAQEYEGYFKVTNTIRLPHVEPSDPNYEQFDNRLRDIAHKNAMFHQFKGLLAETRNMMDYSYANGKVVDQKAFDAMADVVKSIYYNQDNEIVMQKMDVAYDAVKQAADDAGYNNLQYFKYPSLSIRVTTQEITGYYNKLLDIANMGN